jgi:hypothetical protein
MGLGQVGREAGLEKSPRRVTSIFVVLRETETTRGVVQTYRLL